MHRMTLKNKQHNKNQPRENGQVKQNTQAAQSQVKCWDPRMHSALIETDSYNNSPTHQLTTTTTTDKQTSSTDSHNNKPYARLKPIRLQCFLKKKKTCQQQQQTKKTCSKTCTTHIHDASNPSSTDYPMSRNAPGFLFASLSHPVFSNASSIISQSLSSS